ncbi:FMN-binding protein [Nocardioides zeicaulis]|uniref:FMN-binding protein n=1 Tax=Nocardioides zeicaulis TaxID=1776857 RepID=A0ABV6E4R7_9ACTN
MSGVRRIIAWASTTVTLLVLLLGYHTSTSATVASQSETVISSGTVAGSAASRSPGSTTQVAGDVVQTRYGPVQVQLSVSGGEVTSVSVLQYPSGDPRSSQISGYALPVLTDETVSAQSSSIDMVSGATFTSTGYVQSLQSALDRAGL